MPASTATCSSISAAPENRVWRTGSTPSRDHVRVGLQVGFTQAVEVEVERLASANVARCASTSPQPAAVFGRCFAERRTSRLASCGSGQSGRRSLATLLRSMRSGSGTLARHAQIEPGTYSKRRARCLIGSGFARLLDFWRSRCPGHATRPGRTNTNPIATCPRPAGSRRGNLLGDRRHGR
jgi:hypothetical protein